MNIPKDQWDKLSDIEKLKINSYLEFHSIYSIILVSMCWVSLLFSQLFLYLFLIRYNNPAAIMVLGVGITISLLGYISFFISSFVFTNKAESIVFNKYFEIKKKDKK